MLSAVAGQNIRNLRTKNNISQEEIAGRARIAIKTYRKVEDGNNFNMDTLEAISLALGVSPAELLQTWDGDTVDLLELDPLFIEAVRIIPTLNPHNRNLVHLFLLALDKSCDSEVVHMDEE